MADPFISPELATLIDELSLRGFATGKLLGDTYDLVLYRDVDADGEPIAVNEGVPQNVLVEFAAREATANRRQFTAFMGADGELQKEVPFDVQPGDTFRLPPAEGSPPGARGPAGVVGVVLPAEGGVVRAAFTLRV